MTGQCLPSFGCSFEGREFARDVGPCSLRPRGSHLWGKVQFVSLEEGPHHRGPSHPVLLVANVTIFLANVASVLVVGGTVGSQRCQVCVQEGSDKRRVHSAGAHRMSFRRDNRLFHHTSKRLVRSNASHVGNTTPHGRGRCLVGQQRFVPQVCTFHHRAVRRDTVENTLLLTQRTLRRSSCRGNPVHDVVKDRGEAAGSAESERFRVIKHTANMGPCVVRSMGFGVPRLHERKESR